MSAEELRAKIREIPDFPKPGILFYDITTLLKDPVAYKESIDLMLAPYEGERIDIVVGMESRGFIFSAPMAYQLDAGLVPVRKLGKLPAETISVEYALEYGSNTLEIHRDAIQPGQKVLIVDDLLATGGTVKGTIELVERLQGEVVGTRVPRRARLPQGPRSTRRPAGHQRHPVLRPDREAGASLEPDGETAETATLTTGPTARAIRARRRPSRATPPERRPRAPSLLPPVRRRARPDRRDHGRGGPGHPARVRRGGRRDPRPEPGAAQLGGTLETDATATAVPASAPTGFRTPFREDDGVLYMIDQRELPEPSSRSSTLRRRGRLLDPQDGHPRRAGDRPGRGDRAGADRRPGPRTARPYARRATLRGAANALIQARPTAVNLHWAVDRLMARYEAIGDLSEDGDAIADAMRAEADAIVFEATTDHGRLATFGLEALPGRAARTSSGS